MRCVPPTLVPPWHLPPALPPSLPPCVRALTCPGGGQDLVLYVTSSPSAACGNDDLANVAWAATCILDPQQNNRPVAMTTNLCPTALMKLELGEVRRPPASPPARLRAQVLAVISLSPTPPCP